MGQRGATSEARWAIASIVGHSSRCMYISFLTLLDSLVVRVPLQHTASYTVLQSYPSLFLCGNCLVVRIITFLRGLQVLSYPDSYIPMKAARPECLRG